MVHKHNYFVTPQLVSVVISTLNQNTVSHVCLVSIAEYYSSWVVSFYNMQEQLLM